MCRPPLPAIPGSLGIALALLLGLRPPCWAQSPPQNSSRAENERAIDTVLGPRYRAGGFHRLPFGTRYRALWNTPVRVPVLDLGGFGGGLRVVERGAGRESRSLVFVGADGREYVFRAVDKDATGKLPAELQGTLIARLFQDQISGVHPFGPLVADRLGMSIGLPPLRSRLLVLPDDPDLGEFREEFAGVVGYLQERPSAAGGGAGFAGFSSVIGTETLLRLRRERQEAVDVNRYLAARVLDLLLGDWDRRRGQWRWGRPDSSSPWQPVPRDHDYAFSQYDGLLPALARGGPAPYLVRFDQGRLPVLGLVWHSRDLDRELLSALEWRSWNSVVGKCMRV